MSTLPPTDVLRILTDFGPSRADVWPGVDDEHLTVHGQGPDWAEVTEGNKMTWERERYVWNAQAGMVSATTTDSNVWGPGSGWEYRLTPSGSGTQVVVTLTRHGKGVKGKLIAGLLPLIGKSFLRRSLAGPLRAS
jgi:Polyketide cyclase / dehydrase and lipid transport